MRKIISILKKKKFIPLDEFINIALYHSKSGYYNKNYPFGKKGDFITSPLISNLFGEMIAVWCVAYWEHLKKPKKIILVELGPGDGSLCKILLNTFKKFNKFYNCVEIKLLEISKKLKRVQQKNISNKKVKWINNIDDINYGPVIFFGNEFFDSLAIKQIFIKKNLFFEKYVTLLDNKKDLRFALKKTNKNLKKQILNLNLVSSGSTIEYPIEAIKYLNKITKKINKFNGGILTFDYGYTKKINQDTLQSIKNHKFTNLLSNAGSSDISSYVNFKLLSEILKKYDLDVKKIVTQSEFLQTMGIIDRANILAKKMSFKEKADLFYRLKKLLGYKNMGKVFKVLFAQKKGNDFSLGFK